MLNFDHTWSNWEILGFSLVTIVPNISTVLVKVTKRMIFNHMIIKLNNAAANMLPQTVSQMTDKYVLPLLVVVKTKQCIYFNFKYVD